MDGDKKEKTADLQDKSAYPYLTADTIRFQDIDRNNHVNNIAFAVYCETGRTTFIDRLHKDFGNKMEFIVARISVDYLAQAYFPETVEVGTGVYKLGTKSCILAQGVFCKDQCIATSETVWVYFDREKNRSEPLPDDIRGVLEKYRIRGA